MVSKNCSTNPWSGDKASLTLSSALALFLLGV
ncbi:Uncharacterised protein [Vibrio cholerae]|nr:Uncharacterised protein [Vibrio cholerae]